MKVTYINSLGTHFRISHYLFELLKKLSAIAVLLCLGIACLCPRPVLVRVDVLVQIGYVR